MNEIGKGTYIIARTCDKKAQLLKQNKNKCSRGFIPIIDVFLHRPLSKDGSIKSYLKNS